MSQSTVPFVIEAQLEDGQIYRASSWGTVVITPIPGHREPFFKIRLIHPKIEKINQDHDVQEEPGMKSKETVNGPEPQDQYDDQRNQMTNKREREELEDQKDS